MVFQDHIQNFERIIQEIFHHKKKGEILYVSKTSPRFLINYLENMRILLEKEINQINSQEVSNTEPKIHLSLINILKFSSDLISDTSVKKKLYQSYINHFPKKLADHAPELANDIYLTLNSRQIRKNYYLFRRITENTTLNMSRELDFIASCDWSNHQKSYLLYFILKTTPDIIQNDRNQNHLILILKTYDGYPEHRSTIEKILQKDHYNLFTILQNRMINVAKIQYKEFLKATSCNYNQFLSQNQSFRNIIDFLSDQKLKHIIKLIIKEKFNHQQIKNDVNQYINQFFINLINYSKSHLLKENFRFLYTNGFYQVCESLLVKYPDLITFFRNGLTFNLQIAIIRRQEIFNLYFSVADSWSLFQDHFTDLSAQNLELAQWFYRKFPSHTDSLQSLIEKKMETIDFSSDQILYDGEYPLLNTAFMTFLLGGDEQYLPNLSFEMINQKLSELVQNGKNTTLWLLIINKIIATKWSEFDKRVQKVLLQKLHSKPNYYLNLHRFLHYDLEQFAIELPKVIETFEQKSNSSRNIKSHLTLLKKCVISYADQSELIQGLLTHITKLPPNKITGEIYQILGCHEKAYRIFQRLLIDTKYSSITEIIELYLINLSAKMETKIKKKQIEDFQNIKRECDEIIAQLEMNIQDNIKKRQLKHKVSLIRYRIQFIEGLEFLAEKDMTQALLSFENIHKKYTNLTTSPYLDNYTKSNFKIFAKIINIFLNLAKKLEKNLNQYNSEEVNLLLKRKIEFLENHSSCVTKNTSQKIFSQLKSISFSFFNKKNLLFSLPSPGIGCPFPAKIQKISIFCDEKQSQDPTYIFDRNLRIIKGDLPVIINHAKLYRWRIQCMLIRSRNDIEFELRMDDEYDIIQLKASDSLPLSPNSNYSIFSCEFGFVVSTKFTQNYKFSFILNQKGSCNYSTELPMEFIHESQDPVLSTLNSLGIDEEDLKEFIINQYSKIYPSHYPQTQIKFLRLLQYLINYLLMTTKNPKLLQNKLSHYLSQTSNRKREELEKRFQRDLKEYLDGFIPISQGIEQPISGGRADFLSYKNIPIECKFFKDKKSGKAYYKYKSGMDLLKIHLPQIIQYASLSSIGCIIGCDFRDNTLPNFKRLSVRERIEFVIRENRIICIILILANIQAPSISK